MTGHLFSPGIVLPSTRSGNSRCKCSQSFDLQFHRIARLQPPVRLLRAKFQNAARAHRAAAEQIARLHVAAVGRVVREERPDVVRMVVNLKAARAQGIGIPKSILVRADEVIE